MRSRRAFLKQSTLASAGLFLAIEVPKTFATSSTTPFEPNAYITITSDNIVRLWITRSEMGQGVRTTLPMILVEELEADLSQVRLEQAMPGGKFKGIRLRTSGSGSTVGTYSALRKAGATAREMLISAAAQKWKVSPASCRAERGSVYHTATGRKMSYGALTELAAQQPVPDKPLLKDRKTYKLIGTPTKRSDSQAIVTGEAKFGLDMRVNGMLYAVMERCPYFGGRLASFDASKTKAVPGVRNVIAIESGIAPGVAVVADHTWAAMRGRESLQIQWNRGSNSDFDSERFFEQMNAAIDQPSGAYFVRNDGDATAALASATTRHEATYRFPFQAHAPLETMNCIADVRQESCEVWVSTQAPEAAQTEAAKLLGLSPEAVKVHVSLLGGGFGRRLQVDYVRDTVELSRAIGKPVQLVWTRSDDMKFGFFHPNDVQHITGALDALGRPVAWLQRSIGSDLSTLGLPNEEARKNPKLYSDDGLPWGSFDNPYNFPNLKADFIPVNSPVPTGPWRAVFYPPTVFARESFLDELAHASGQDPLEFRLHLLAPGDVLTLGDARVDRGRLKSVLQLAAEKAGWKTALPQSTDRAWGRGIACNVYDSDCYIAQVAEVSVGKKEQDIRVHRVVCAVDCGLVINPAGLEGQSESGIIWGLSATLHGKIDFKNGTAVQENYNDFDVVRMNESPTVETYIVPSERDPGGFGETAVPPIAPAVANAIFAAVGKRVRDLPITPENLRA
ncbi:MAG TPA: molybdopterin cofactor-binding domain-containing protein [Terriglobales bacterium]|jgi:isoquinoline 1-oxidoreductase beta subunit